MAETGMLGFPSIGLFGPSLLAGMLKRLLLSRSNGLRLWSFAMLPATTGFVVPYQTFSTLYIPHIWVTIGLAAGLLAMARKDKRGKVAA